MLHQLAILPVLLIAGAVAPSFDGDEEFSMYSQSWYLGIKGVAATQREMLAAAYDLDEGQLLQLESEHARRIHAQHAYMENPPATLKGLAPEDAEGREAELIAEISQFYENMPMNPDRVADWLEKELLLPDQAPLGRHKFNELQHLDLQRKSLKSDDVEDRVRIGREMRSLRGSSSATLNELGQWLPVDIKMSSATDKTRTRWRVDSVRRDRVTVVPDGVRQMGAQPLPCFDDWRSVADSVCVRARRENPAALARIWSEFTMRAWRRIALAPAIYDEIQSIESNQSVAEILADQGIQTDLDALRQEFRIRLQAIEDSCNSNSKSANLAAGG